MESRKKLKASRHARQKSRPTSAEPLSVTQLLDSAEAFADAEEFEPAHRCCTRALELAPDDLRALETTGVLMLELGSAEAAKHCFGRAVELRPEHGHFKYLCLGQLFEAEQAVHFYGRAAQLMSAALAADVSKAMEDEEATAEQKESIFYAMRKSATQRDLSAAYCAIAELHMTDLNEKADAEERCLAAIEQAMAADGTDPEPLVQMAEFQLSRTSADEAAARTALQASLALWLPQCRLAASEAASASAVPCLPYDMRVKSARLLVELQQYDECLDVLDFLMEEHDDDTQVWYLTALSHFKLGEENWAAAKYHFARARQLAEAEDEDPDTLAEMDSYLEQLKDIEIDLDEEDAEEEVDSDNDDDWSTADEDEETEQNEEAME